MQEGFCVFWIPTTYHQDISPLENIHDIINEDISDNVGTKYLLTMHLKDDQSIDIVLRMPDSDNDEITFVLERLEAHKNGLFLYKFIVEEPYYNMVSEALRNPIYHHVKGFYHQHVYHGNDNDSILDAYVEKDISNLNEPDNKPLIHYLTQYEQRFLLFAEQLEEDAKYLEEQSEIPDRKALVYGDLYNQFSIKYVNMTGEIMYYHALLNSRYNRSCHLMSHDHLQKNRLYTIPLNINNAIARIHLVEKRTRTIFENKRGNATLKNIQLSMNLTNQSIQLSQDINSSLKKSDWLAKISIILGIISFALGVLSVYLALPQT